MAWGGVPCDNYPWYLQPHHTGTPRMGPQPPTQGYPPFLYSPFASRGGPHPDGWGVCIQGKLNLYPEGGCIQRGWGALCLGGGESVSRAGRGLYPGGGGGFVSRGDWEGESAYRGGGRLPPPPVIFHPASCMDQWPQIFNRNIGYFIFLYVGGNENHQTLPRRGRRRNRYGARSSFRSSGRTTTGSHKLLPVPKSSQWWGRFWWR